MGAAPNELAERYAALPAICQMGGLSSGFVAFFKGEIGPMGTLVVVPM